ncbi:tyrosine recombinase [Paenibacillus agilis]|uniref:Tyrosine recombinase n=1 Tax=Paenibacillus agilis TaxID=3020863 RepID=A0A559IYW3_9BACL|nr:tyrosine recombinase [Paenibacillus agilis]TVX92829.1 tyrosine recombinase [Paenibacillus agilis]
MKTTLERQMAQYMQYLTDERQISPHTKDAYERDIQSFVRHLSAEGIEQANEVLPVHLFHYVSWLRRQGRAASTITRHKAALRAFYRYLIREGEASKDPTMDLEVPKSDPKQLTVLSIEQVGRLLEAPSLHTPQGIRDRAMLETLYGTGARVSELLDLNISDVNLQLGFVRCVMNRKERIVPLGEVAIEAIRIYLEKSREDLQSQSSGDKMQEGQALFLNRHGQRMTRQGFWKRLRTYAAHIPDMPDLTLQMLRQTFAVHLLNNGADIRVVQELLGHADAATTQRYASIPEKPNMKEVYSSAHPRAKKNK